MEHLPVYLKTLGLRATTFVRKNSGNGTHQNWRGPRQNTKPCETSAGAPIGGGKAVRLCQCAVQRRLNPNQLTPRSARSSRPAAATPACHLSTGDGDFSAAARGAAGGRPANLRPWDLRTLARCRSVRCRCRPRTCRRVPSHRREAPECNWHVPLVCVFFVACVANCCRTEREIDGRTYIKFVPLFS